MPHDIFGDVTRPPAKLGSQSWYTVPLSIVVHALIVAVVVIVPLMATDVIPTPSSILTVVVPTPPAPEPPPAPLTPRAAAPSTTGPNTPAVTSPRSLAPTAPGDKIGEEVSIPALPPGPGHVAPIGEIVGDSSTTGIAVRIPEVPQPPVTGPVRAGGIVKYPEKVRDVRPQYPRLAIDGKVEGRVTIEAIIGIDGRVKDARVLNSIPLLDRAALEAVQQWRFTPTLLNGVPVPVIITVTVDFKLN